VSDVPSTPTPGPAEPASAATAGAPAAAPTAVLDPPADATTPDPASDPAPAPSKSGHRLVQVPVWLLAVLGVLVLVVGAFFVGRSTADTTSGPDTLADAVEQTARGDMEVGDFDTTSLITALQQNEDLDLGVIGRILEGFVTRDGFQNR
jgi:hypothetical protein